MESDRTFFEFAAAGRRSAAIGSSDELARREPPLDRGAALEEPRRTAGLDASGESVRLAERDSSGRLVGYIDEQGLGSESLIERIVAVRGQRLAEALALAHDDPRCDPSHG